MKIAAHFATILIGVQTLSSCATAPGPSFQKTEVIERIADRDKTPDWATGESVMSSEKDQVVFISVTTMNGDARPESCMKVASESSRTEIIRHIKDNLTTSGQISEDSASSDPSIESLTAFLAQGKLSGVSVLQKYWEKRVESDKSGERVLRLFCAAKVGIKKSDLERQLKEALGKGGNAEIRKQQIEAQKKFIENIPNGSETASAAE